MSETPSHLFPSHKNKKQPKTELEKKLESANRQKLEDVFEQQLKTYNVKGYVKEHKFHGKRNWRFDFAWIDHKIAVEIQGGTRIKSGHTTHAGISRDCEKGNAALVLGWKVLHATTDQLNDLSLIDSLRTLLKILKN